MDAFDVLSLMAEISVAMVGFSGIVVSLRPGARPLVGLVYLLQTASALVILSLLPIALQHFGAEAATIWATASAVAAVYMIVINVIAHVRIEARFKAGLYRLFSLGFYTFGALGIANAILYRDFAIYFVILIWLLIYCLLLFTAMIVQPAGQRDGVDS